MVNAPPQGIRLVPRNTFEVCEGMFVQAAINAAAAQLPAPSATNPWTILIYPGIYDEPITCAPWVNLKGIGPKGSVVIYQNDADVVIGADDVQIENLTLRLGTITVARAHLTDNAVAITMRLSELILEVVTPGAASYHCLDLTGNGSDFIVERCYAVIGGTGNALFLISHTGVVTILFREVDVTLNNANAHHIYSGANNTIVYGKGNRWAGTAGFVQLVNAPILNFDHDSIICTGAWSNTGSTMMLRNCAIEAPVVAGNGAVVRMKNCSYKAIQRAGTGAIVDESPYLSDAPWKVVKWNWMTALANMDVAARGTPIDAGSGQVLLEVTDNVADAEAVEANPAAAGSLDNEFTPARIPRFITKIAVDNFDTHVTMFFGLRETLGNAAPGAGEEHAGFAWDGTNFQAVNGDGAVALATNLTTPTVDTQVQLEVMTFPDDDETEFYVDGVLVATHVERAPTAGLDWQHLLATAGAGGGDVIQVTVRPGGVQECPA